MTAAPIPLVADAMAITCSDEVRVRGRAFGRLVLRTPWLGPQDDLEDVLRDHVLAHVRPGDTIAISEKVAVLVAGRPVPVSAVRPGRLARFLVARVHPRQGSRGLSVPEKMQYVLDRAGRPRILLAAAVSALTRPLGVHGAFYRVAGSLARDLDGGRPPYEHLLFPPLARAEAATLCRRLESRLGVGIAVVDLNDFGGRVRATSPAAPSAATLMRVLADNPMGQRCTGTPVVVVRPVRSRRSRWGPARGINAPAAGARPAVPAARAPGGRRRSPAPAAPPAPG